MFIFFTPDSSDQRTATAESYVPVFASSGAGAIVAVGQFRALKVWDPVQQVYVVTVIGQFGFSPAVAGVAETINMTLPAIGQPAANFAATADLTGSATLQGIMAATDGATAVEAVVGAKKAETTITSNLVSVPCVVSFAYQVAA